MDTIQTEVTEETNICQTVIEAIAEAEETHPTDLSPPLYKVIDPDSLENLFTDERTLGKVKFNYNNCEVSIFSDEYVSVKNHGPRARTLKESL